MMMKAGGGSDEHPGLTSGARLYDGFYLLPNRSFQKIKAYFSPTLFLFFPFFTEWYTKDGLHQTHKKVNHRPQGGKEEMT